MGLTLSMDTWCAMPSSPTHILQCLLWLFPLPTSLCCQTIIPFVIGGLTWCCPCLPFLDAVCTALQVNVIFFVLFCFGLVFVFVFFSREKDFLLQKELYLHMAQGGTLSRRFCYLTHLGQFHC